MHEIGLKRNLREIPMSSVMLSAATALGPILSAAKG